MTENAKAIEHLQTLVGLFSLDDHNKRIDALSWLIDDRARMHAELERLRVVCDQGSQLNADVMRRAQRAEAQLAAGNALLGRIGADSGQLCDHWVPDLEVHLAG